MPIKFNVMAWERPAERARSFDLVGEGLSAYLQPKPSYIAQEYTPPQNLFMTFKEIRNVADVIDFANRYGLLKKNKWKKAPRNKTPPTRDEWWDQLRKLTPMTEEFNKLANNKPPMTVGDWLHTAASMRDLKKLADNLKDMKGEEAERAAAQLLRQRQWVNAAVVHAPIRVEGGTIIFEPPDLETFLWFDLMRAFEHGSAFKPCEVCESLIEIGGDPKAKRRDTKFCSASCRVKSCRDNKKKSNTTKKSNTQRKGKRS
jgi:hypothetical protein